MEMPSVNTIIKKWTTNERCIVVGAHAFILKVSSFFGMAPLHFKPQGNGYIVSISTPMCIYSYLLITALVTFTFFGLISEVRFGLNPCRHMSTHLSQAISCCDITMLCLLGSAGVYGAPKRMRNMIKIMRTIASVDKKIGVRYSHTREHSLCIGFLFFILVLTVMLIDDICLSTVQARNREWDMVRNYLGFYLLWYFVTILELQFAFTAITVYRRFKAVNEALSLSAKRLSETYKTGETNPESSPNDTVHQIASLRTTLFDVVQQLEHSYSISLVIILVSTLFHLIITPYFGISEIHVRGSAGLCHFLILHFMWYTLHVLRLFTIVEPCHYTTLEGNKTENLVCRMMMMSPNSGALASRLELFSRQLMLQPICYKPMGACTLDRPVIAAIFGAVTTYLVILIQFQSY